MVKTTTKASISNRTALILAMSAVSFPSYALGPNDDTYTGADEGQIIINNRDWISNNDAFINELKDIKDNPPPPIELPPEPGPPPPKPPASTGSITKAPISNRKCAETYEDEIRDIEYGKLGLDIAAIALEITGEATQGLPFGAGMAGGAIVVGALTTQIANVGLGYEVLKKDAQAADAPSCGQEFVGDIDVTEGASVIVTDISGDKTLSLGPDSTGQLQAGVSIGGGQITGAGNSLAQDKLAIASDPSAIAIGNSAKALAVNSTAIGENSVASGVYSSSYGGQSQATGQNSTAIGRDARATKTNTSATGVSSRATGENSTATGANAQAT
ncbi:hypothetical protein ACTXLJ_12645, partial [Psychrobacter celer]